MTAPNGLCADRTDHEPHTHISNSLGEYWCTARQEDREPYRSEQRRQHATVDKDITDGYADGGVVSK